MKFSFTTFFAIQPMPAARPVKVAASMIVFTSLLSDMVILKNIFFQYGGGCLIHISNSYWRRPDWPLARRRLFDEKGFYLFSFVVDSHY